MTIEDQDAPVRCRECGAWLPPTALACPRCGSPRDLRMAGIPRRPLPTRWLVIGGGGLALLIGVVAWAMLQTTAPDPIAQATPTPSPLSSTLPSVTPSATASATGTPRLTPDASRTPFPVQTPAPTPLPPRPPLVLTAGVADIGSRGVVTAGTLRVRSFPGLDSEIMTVLEGGTDLLMRDGPVAADGLDWYLAIFAALPYGTYGELTQGWVAVGPTGAIPTLVQIGPARCPNVTVTASLLGSTGGLARSQCLPGSHEFTAVVDTCFEGPITPYEYEPLWLWFSCYSLFDLGSDAHLQIHFPPAVPQPSGLVRGSVVHVTGHFDDPAAASCEVSVTPGTGVPQPSEVVQAVFRLDCAAAFVLDEIDIVDTIDLPPLF